ncbi:MAG: hypothetical protein PWP04_960 [Candidatus Atribacteria bacterium]|nr:hypothetical protein [Candidatus Atribacteria bacterium]
MVPPVDWKSGLWWVSSLILFLVIVGFFWITPPSPLPPEAVEGEGGTAPLPATSEVLLEKAMVTRVELEGKKWELRADSIKQEREKITLFGVDGLFFSLKEQPVYQVEAGRGWIDLKQGNLNLEELELSSFQGEILIGESLTWEGEEDQFIINQAKFDNGKIKVSCRRLIYDMSAKKLFFEEEVEVDLRF